MNLLKTIGATLNAWTGSVAGAVIAGLDRVVSPRVVRLVEDDDGGFAVEATGKADSMPSRIAFADGALSAPNLAPLFRGSRVEIVLQPKRFLFRPLELPARAADFLEGIVRAQIDRLTPWSASEAVFGCSAPARKRAESITTMIAATTRKVGDGLCAGGVGVSSGRGRHLHRCCRARRRARQGVRAEGARPSRRRAAEPRAAGRARRRWRRRRWFRSRSRPMWPTISAAQESRTGAADFGAARRDSRRR